MKELKFRAWDGKKMIDDVIPVSETSIIELFEYEWKETEVKSVEQYTGLKDKNGKEIYEGDILQIDDHIIGDFEVLWHNLGWSIKRSIGFETLSVHKPNDIVVIGNIHEDADLLERK